MAEQVHVVAHNENWAVRVANRDRVESTHTTEEAAVTAGRALAENLNAELKLHKLEWSHRRIPLARQRSAQHSLALKRAFASEGQVLDRRTDPPSCGEGTSHVGALVQGSCHLLRRCRDVPGLRRRWVGRPARPGEPARLLVAPRRDLLVAQPHPSHPEQGQRLRRRRLLRHRRAARHLGRLHGAGSRGAGTRHSHPARPRCEPHERPASVVSGGLLECGVAIPRLVCLERF